MYSFRDAQSGFDFAFCLTETRLLIIPPLGYFNPVVRECKARDLKISGPYAHHNIQVTQSTYSKSEVTQFTYSKSFPKNGRIGTVFDRPQLS